MKCSKCGKEISDGAHFCSECGMKIDPSEGLKNGQILSEQSATSNLVDQDYLSRTNEVKEQTIKTEKSPNNIEMPEEKEIKTIGSKMADEADDLANKAVKTPQMRMEIMENECTGDAQKRVNTALNKDTLFNDQADNQDTIDSLSGKAQGADQIIPKQQESVSKVEQNPKNQSQNNSPELMSMGDYILTMIICALPIAGLVMTIIWGFTSHDIGPNKQNFARALFIMKLISIVLNITIIMVVIFSILGSTYFAPYPSAYMF